MMKKTFLKTVGTTALAILLVTIFAQISVFAQDIISQDQNEIQTENKLLLTRALGNPRALEGTWDTEVTIRNCQNNAAIRTFASIGTFMFGGTSIGSTSGMPQALRTPEHGVWNHLNGRRFRFKFKSFSFDAGGNFTGWTIVAHTIEMNPDGNSYTSAGTAEIYNPAGILVAALCSSAIATRFE